MSTAGDSRQPCYTPPGARPFRHAGLSSFPLSAVEIPSLDGGVLCPRDAIVIELEKLFLSSTRNAFEIFFLKKLDDIFFFLGYGESLDPRLSLPLSKPLVEKVPESFIFFVINSSCDAGGSFFF